MAGNRNSLVESTKDTKSIALTKDKNHEDIRNSEVYQKNRELLRKYIFTDVHISFIELDRTIWTFIEFFLFFKQGFTEDDYFNSTGERVISKSPSYEYDAATSYDDANYSEYDFDDEEEASCNVKFNFRLFRDAEIPMSGKKKYELND